MIPAPIIAEAREAFDRHLREESLDYLDALADYEAVLSRHWPAADGREALQQIASGVTHAPDDVVAIVRAALATSAPAESMQNPDKIAAILDRMARQLNESDRFSLSRDEHIWRFQNFQVRSMMEEIARIIAPTDAAPAENVRVVRVAVARDEAGDFHLKIVRVDDDLAWDWLASMQDAGERLCIAEIPVPIRDVPTVRASVEAAGNG